MNVLEFMSDSPFLTFFLALVVYELIESIARAITGKYPPIKCDKCGDDKVGDDNDK